MMSLQLCIVKWLLVVIQNSIEVNNFLQHTNCQYNSQQQMTPCIRSSALALTRRTIVLRSWCSVSPCDICIIEKCMSNQPSRRHLTTRNTVPPHLKPNFKTTLNGSTTPNAADTTQHKNDRNITPPAQPPVVDRHHSHPDGLTRYPSLRSPNGMLRGLDWLGRLATGFTSIICGQMFHD